MTQKTNENRWTMDVRVRERNLKSGALTDKDLEKYLMALPDLADRVEPFATPQPALAQPPQSPVVVSAAQAVADDADDADDGEDEDEDTDEAGPEQNGASDAAVEGTTEGGDGAGELT